MEKYKVFTRWCAVHTCKRSDVKLRKLPENQNKLKKWLDVIKNPFLYTLKGKKIKQYGICDLHFEDKQYANALKLTLNSNAVPSLNLPEEEIAGMIQINHEDPNSIVLNEYAENIVVEEIVEPEFVILNEPNVEIDYFLDLTDDYEYEVNDCKLLKENLKTYTAKSKQNGRQVFNCQMKQQNYDQVINVKFLNKILVPNINLRNEHKVNVSFIDPLESAEIQSEPISYFCENDKLSFKIKSSLKDDPRDLIRAKQLLERQKYMKFRKNICRFCLDVEIGLTNIFYSVSETDKSIFAKYSSLFPDTILQDTDTYNLICLECINKLEMACEFQNKCHISNLELKNYLHKDNIPDDEIFNLDIRKKVPEFKKATKIVDSHDFETDTTKNDTCSENITENELNKNLNLSSLHKENDEDVLHTFLNLPEDNSVSTFDDSITFSSTKATSKRAAEKCSFCDLSFETFLLLKSHMKLHLNGNISSHIASYECQICSQKFRNYNHLSRHTRLAHTDVNKKVLLRFKCTHCGKTFRDQKLFNLHQKRHLNIGYTETCAFCGKKFKSAEKLKTHINVHTGDKRYECDLCDRHFFSGLSLENHRKLKHFENQDKVIVCEICGKLFASLVNLECHKTVHTNDRLYECYECKKEFKSKLGYISHVKHHTDVRLYECQICGRSYKCKSHLEIHQRIHTDVKSYECSECGKKFKYWSGFSRHKRLHTGERPYSCTQCDQKFIAHDLLRIHKLRDHTTTRNFKCDECELAFYSNYLLKQHKICHTDEFSHICEFCGKAFQRDAGLKKHIKNMHDTTVYNCEFCDLTFKFAGTYYMHREKHGIERNFECDFCHVAFGSKYVLEKHLKTHSEKPYKCQKCEAAFDDENDLKTHICATYECKICFKVYYRRKSYRNHLWAHKTASRKKDDAA